MAIRHAVRRAGQPAHVTIPAAIGSGIMWMQGERPAGLTDVTIEVDCTMRSADVPSSQPVSD